jgi:nucleoid-associated protein YgaU
MFPITSRYYSTPTAKLEKPAGTTIAYLRRRFVPPPENFTLLQEYVVKSGDRLDNIAAQFLDDPEQFWRIADANNAMQPDDLTQPVGRVLCITLPEGVPGNQNA